jgi:hypothetical protein
MIVNDKKLLGDSGEHYAMSMLGFNGILCSKLPDNWKHYDLIVQRDNRLERVSVKTRSESPSFGKGSWFRFESTGMYEWVIFIVKFRNSEIRSWIIPFEIAVKNSSTTREESGRSEKRTISWGKLEQPSLLKYLNNWTLLRF